MVEKISHLDETQIIEAVIDADSLEPGPRRHLFECPDCRAQKQALEGKLAFLGQISREQTTVDFTKPEIIRHRPAGIFNRVWEISPVLRMGAVLASLIILLFTPLTLRKDVIYTLDKVYQEMRQDDEFIKEIEQLEDDPFPRSYKEASAPTGDERGTQSPGALNDGMTKDGGPRNA
jgi:hypothetical protein